MVLGGRYLLRRCFISYSRYSQFLLYASKKRLYVTLWLMWLASLIPSIAYLMTFHQTFAQLSSPSTDIWAVPQLGILGVLNFNP